MGIPFNQKKKKKKKMRHRLLSYRPSMAFTYGNVYETSTYKDAKHLPSLG